MLSTVVKRFHEIGMSAREERIKLRAAYLNGLAVAVAAVGGIAPMVSLLARSDANPFATALLALVCLATSGVLHWTASQLLGRLDL